MKKKFISIAVAAAISSTVVSIGAFAQDPNGDGAYLLNDSVLIYQFLAGNYQVSNLTALDYNKSGVITEADAVQLQQDIMANDIDTSILMGDNTSVDDIIFNETMRHYAIYNAQTGSLNYMQDYYIDCAEEYNNDISNYRYFGGSDDRVVDFSKTGVVKIITEVNGVPHFGTGFIVGSHTIATAAHVVSNSQPYKSAIIKDILSFNANGSEREDSITPLEIHVPSEFDITSSSDEVLSYDYALITVEEDLSNYPFFEFGIYDNILDRDVTASTTGFPGQIHNNITGEDPRVNSGTDHIMYTGTDVVYSSDGGVINHRIDASSGNSGGPIYITEMINGNAVNIVFGIHNLDDDPNYSITGYNHAVQINSDMINFFKNNPHIPE